MNTNTRDQKLIERVLKGNSNAFANIVDDYKNMVYSIAIKVLRNREDAEEVSQDTFVKAYNSLNTYKGEAKFSTWMYRIAYNTAISRLRKEKRKKDDISIDEKSDVSINQITKTLEPLESEDRINYLNEAMNRLGSDDQLALTMFYLEEKSIKEIIEITGWTQSNTKIKLYRGRKKLYDELNNLLGSEIDII